MVRRPHLKQQDLTLISLSYIQLHLKELLCPNSLCLTGWGGVSNLGLNYWQHFSDVFPLVRQHLREMTRSHFFIVDDNIK